MWVPIFIDSDFSKQIFLRQKVNIKGVKLICYKEHFF